MIKHAAHYNRATYMYSVLSFNCSSSVYFSEAFLDFGVFGKITYENSFVHRRLSCLWTVHQVTDLIDFQ